MAGPLTLSMSDDHPPVRPLHIFVVEDDPAEQEIFRVHLEAAGHTVSAAFNMKYALQRLASRRYDVLIVDIGLPDGDGWELMREVRLAHPLFAVAVTARNSGADREQSCAAGFRHHFVKPVRLREIDEVLREAAGECTP